MHKPKEFLPAMNQPLRSTRGTTPPRDSCLKGRSLPVSTPSALRDGEKEETSFSVRSLYELLTWPYGRYWGGRVPEFLSLNSYNVAERQKHREDAWIRGRLKTRLFSCLVGHHVQCCGAPCLALRTLTLQREEDCAKASLEINNQHYHYSAEPTFTEMSVWVRPYVMEWCSHIHMSRVYSVAGLSRCSRLTLLRTRSTKAPLHQGLPGSLWKLGRLNHIAIAVPDMEKATALYRDVLGATVSDQVPVPEHGVYTVFVELGNTKLELLHPLGEKSPIAGFLQKNKSGGMHHICIEVDNINAAIADLKAKNIRTLSAEPRIGAHGKPVMFLHPKDCDGVLVELEEA